MNTLKLISYRVLFTSETAPTKLSVAIASIIWALIILFTDNTNYTHIVKSSNIQHVVAISFAIYGVGLIWRVFDKVHRTVISCILTFFGSALWIAMTWSMIFQGEIISEILAANISITLASCWLFIRTETGEIIVSKKNNRVS